MLLDTGNRSVDRQVATMVRKVGYLRAINKRSRVAELFESVDKTNDEFCLEAAEDEELVEISKSLEADGDENKDEEVTRIVNSHSSDVVDEMLGLRNDQVAAYESALVDETFFTEGANLEMFKIVKEATDKIRQTNKVVKEAIKNKDWDTAEKAVDEAEKVIRGLEKSMNEIDETTGLGSAILGSLAVNILALLTTIPTGGTSARLINANDIVTSINDIKDGKFKITSLNSFRNLLKTDFANAYTSLKRLRYEIKKNKAKTVKTETAIDDIDVEPITFDEFYKSLDTYKEEAIDDLVNSLDNVYMSESVALLSAGALKTFIAACGVIYVSATAINLTNMGLKRVHFREIEKYFEATDPKFIPISKMTKKVYEISDAVENNPMRTKEIKSKVLGLLTGTNKKIYSYEYDGKEIFSYAISLKEDKNEDDTRALKRYILFYMKDSSLAKYDDYYKAKIMLNNDIGGEDVAKYIDSTYKSLKGKIKETLKDKKEPVEESAEDMYINEAYDFSDVDEFNTALEAARSSFKGVKVESPMHFDMDDEFTDILESSNYVDLFESGNDDSYKQYFDDFFENGEEEVDKNVKEDIAKANEAVDKVAAHDIETSSINEDFGLIDKINAAHDLLCENNDAVNAARNEIRNSCIESTADNTAIKYESTTDDNYEDVLADMLLESGSYRRVNAAIARQKLAAEIAYLKKKYNEHPRKRYLSDISELEAELKDLRDNEKKSFKNAKPKNRNEHEDRAKEKEAAKEYILSNSKLNGGFGKNYIYDKKSGDVKTNVRTMTSAGSDKVSDAANKYYADKLASKKDPEVVSKVANSNTKKEEPNAKEPEVVSRVVNQPTSKSSSKVVSTPIADTATLKGEEKKPKEKPVEVPKDETKVEPDKDTPKENKVADDSDNAKKSNFGKNLAVAAGLGTGAYLLKKHMDKKKAETAEQKAEKKALKEEHRRAREERHAKRVAEREARKKLKRESVDSWIENGDLDNVVLEGGGRYRAHKAQEYVKAKKLSKDIDETISKENIKKGTPEYDRLMDKKKDAEEIIKNYSPNAKDYKHRTSPHRTPEDIERAQEEVSNYKHDFCPGYVSPSSKNGEELTANMLDRYLSSGFGASSAVARDIARSSSGTPDRLDRIVAANIAYKSGETATEAIKRREKEAELKEKMDNFVKTGKKAAVGAGVAAGVGVGAYALKKHMDKKKAETAEQRAEKKAIKEERRKAREERHAQRVAAREARKKNPKMESVYDWIYDGFLDNDVVTESTSYLKSAHDNELLKLKTEYKKLKDMVDNHPESPYTESMNEAMVNLKNKIDNWNPDDYTQYYSEKV